MVTLPNATMARVEESKVLTYLLSTSHKDGKSQAEFFLRHGFSRERWTEFGEALRFHALMNAVSEVRESEHGTTFRIDGILEMPDGRNSRIRTVWFISADGHVPRLATAYPLER